MRITEGCTPVPSSNRQHAQLGNDDGGADGGGDFFGGLDAESHVAFGVANDDDGLESGTLTGAGLLLNGLDLDFHHMALASCNLSSSFLTIWYCLM